MLIFVRSHFDFASGAVVDGGLDREIEERYAPRKGIVVESSRALLSSRGDAKRLFADTSHWTDAGKDVIAGGLVEPVSRLLGSPRRCSRPGG